MTLGDNLYSQIVAWLKIILPLAALGLLSTLFLLSRSVDPTSTIPFAEIDLAERARDQGVTAPSFAGATEQGDLISFSAEKARPDPAMPDRAIAEDVKGTINLTSGTSIRFSADTGKMDQPADLALMQGHVVITSSLGYTIRTEELSSAMERIWAETEGPIQANGPPGDFSAGRMLLRTVPNGSDVQLFFTNGVKLIYDPKKSRN